MALFGHRAPHDYEVAEPRYRETPSVALAMASRSSRGPAPRNASKSPAPIEKRVLCLSVERARRYQALKEEAKHHAMRKTAFLRTLLLEIGDRIGVGEGIFHLTPAEVRDLREPAFREGGAARRILERQESLEALRDVQLPREITPVLLESLDVDRGTETLAPRGAQDLCGTRVSGTGEVTGRVRTLRRAEEIDTFRKGEILVARFTDPTWTSIFPLASGIVTEVGGWLSHAAIQAREYGITGIVGAAGALEALRNGDLVTLRSDGGIVRVPERRAEERFRVSLTAGLRRTSETMSANLGDLSHRGALLLVPGGKLEIGERIDLAIQDRAEIVPATVVRNGLPGIYGLRFEHGIEPEQAAAFGTPTASDVQVAV
jgi:phosphohistidine swiveling domain-containing protein